MPVILPVSLPHAVATHHSTSTYAASAHKSKSAPTNQHASRSAAKKPARAVRTVTVHAEDTVYAIARREHSTVAAIVKANRGLDVRRLVPGTLLRVPVAGKTEATHKGAQHQSAPPTSATTRQQTFAPKPEQVITYVGTKEAQGYSKEQVASGDAHRHQLAQVDLPTQDKLHSMIVATAKRYGVSPTLALGIGWQESGFQQSAVSVCDAIGTMQVMPETGEWAGQLLGKKLDIMQAQDNITAGITTLRYLTEHAKDQDEVIGSYYQGLGAMQEHGPYSDTKQYIASVKAHMARFTHS